MSHRLLTSLRRRFRTFVSLDARPVLRFADELAQLGDQRARVRTFTVERFNALEPRQDCARLVHTAKVTEKGARLRAAFVSTCSAQREVAGRPLAHTDDRVVE